MFVLVDRTSQDLSDMVEKPDFRLHRLATELKEGMDHQRDEVLLI